MDGAGFRIKLEENLLKAVKYLQKGAKTEKKGKQHLTRPTMGYFRSKHKVYFHFRNQSVLGVVSTAGTRAKSDKNK